MRKPELAASIAEQANISKVAAGEALNTVLDTITLALSKGERVALPGFGSFTRSARAARTGLNPKTGESMAIAASNSVSFKAGKALRDAIDGS